MSDESKIHEGACFCGAVKVAVKNPPVGVGYCHCLSCRKWHAAPLNAWAIWKNDDVSFTEGKDLLREFNMQGEGGPSTRLSCERCGSCVANRKPQIGMTVVYAMTLFESGWKYEPGFHIFYDERVLDLHDDLPKYADVPEAFGGTGTMVDEPTKTGLRA